MEYGRIAHLESEMQICEARCKFAKRNANLFVMNHRDTEKTQRAKIPDEVNYISGRIIDTAVAVHCKLGPGLLESVYEKCMICALWNRRIDVRSQVILLIEFEGLVLPTGLRIDLLAGNCVIVEIKAVDVLLPVHKAQLLTYLRLSGFRIGLLINFNVPLIKDGITRMTL